MKKKTIYVKGMHCPSCNILIEDKCKEISNIRQVAANFKNQEATIYYKGDFDFDELNSKIRQYGYQAMDKASVREIQEPFSSRLFQASAIFAIILIGFFFAQELNIVPSLTISSSMSLGVALLLGIVASTSTCMATSGALFLSTIGKLQSTRMSFTQNILPAISFNAGRIISYGFFGFVFGLFGKTLVQNFQMGPLLLAFVSVFMVLIGLDMMQLISFQKIINFGFTKNIFQRLEKKLIKNPKQTAFFLGAITYLLPCGFTQSIQLYALGLADPWKSSLIMMVFAVGTVPMLMAIGFASSFTKSSYYALFSRVMGVLIFIIAISNIINILPLYGFKFNLTKTSATETKGVETKDGYQIVNMNVNSRGYSPNLFTIKKGIPVRWQINGENVFGCQASLYAPAVGVTKILKPGQNIVEFTPKDTGTISFSCSMGMYRGSFNVI